MALVFDATDNADIITANAAGGKIWKNKCLDRLKQKIKDDFIFDDTSQCCYCARLFKGEFRMVIDIEHILPQSIFSTERFAIANLNVACKRCNMEIKKADTSFILSIPNMGINYYQSQHYKIIHPNLDTYTTHIVLKTVRNGNAIFIKYVKKDDQKGKYTYDYFKLNELELDTINKAQGGKANKTISALISDKVRNALLNLLTKI
ncbi:MAG: HNH endonuclease [Flavobacterium sp.]